MLQMDLIAVYESKKLQEIIDHRGLLLNRWCIASTFEALINALTSDNIVSLLSHQSLLA